MPTYEFHWNHGTVSKGQGRTPEEALTILGYGGGSIPALDYYEQVPDDDDKPFFTAADCEPLLKEAASLLREAPEKVWSWKDGCPEERMLALADRIERFLATGVKG